LTTTPLPSRVKAASRTSESWPAIVRNPAMKPPYSAVEDERGAAKLQTEKFVGGG
jgi:hypothetical protein